MTFRGVEAAAELTRASLVLRLTPSRRTVDLLGTIRSSEHDERVAAGQIETAVRVGLTIARVAARLPWRPTCLRQALAAQRMLRRRGIPCRLHLGVTGVTEAEAHAWVTVGSEPVVGRSGIERYVPLAAFE